MNSKPIMKAEECDLREIVIWGKDVYTKSIFKNDGYLLADITGVFRPMGIHKISDGNSAFDVRFMHEMLVAGFNSA